MGPRQLIVLLVLLLQQVHVFAEAPPAAAVASAHPLATQAGQEILMAGGNAFDAAVAVSAALAVVEPSGSGIGGGGFWLLHRAKDQLYTMVDGREMAPSRAHRDMYLDEQGNVVPGLSINGPLAAGIPGAPAAWVHLAEKYGRLPLALSLTPAIRYARDGFEIKEHYLKKAKFRLAVMQNETETARIFLQDGELPPAGYLLKQPDLAHTLEALAKKGRAGFYEGAIARLLVSGVQEAGGIWELADLQNYKVIERKPITGSFKDLKIVSAAPPSSGGIAIVTMLNILQKFPLRNLSEVQRVHHVVEAMRLAYRDRAKFLGDSDFVQIPVEKLISKKHGDFLRNQINSSKANPSASLPPSDIPAEGQDTSHFSILDREGNRVSATLSINYPFGAAFVAPGTGVLLNDEMDDFSSKPGTPNAYGLVGAEANAIAPGKRPLSSMSPSFVEHQDGVAIIGTPGGSRIITMVLLGILEYANGGSAESIVSFPRFHHQYLPDAIQYETDGLESNTMKALKKMGHALKPVGRKYGNMHVVIWNKKRKRVTAASDPRGGGAAVVQ